jgi:putative flippase GtrA
MIVRYFFVGATAALVDWILFACLVVALEVPWFPAAASSFVVATAVNYLLSIRHVFRSGVRFARANEIGLVFLVSGIGLVINQVFMWVLVELAAWPLMPSKICATGVVFLWNFGARSHFIFREPA